MIVKPKLTFYELAELGLCGNTPRIFRDPKEAYASGIPYFGIRGITPSYQGFRTAIHRSSVMDLGNLLERYVLCESDGIRATDLSHRGLQGELGWVNGAWCLHYSHILGCMRHRLQYYGQHALGWQVTRLLRGHLDPSSFDELMGLFDRYTEGDNYPVIEFSSGQRPMGRLSRTTVIWEVRNGY